MTGKQLTTYSIIGLLGIAAVVEIRSFLTKEEGDTISSRFALLIDKYPVTAALAPAVVTHCMTPTRIDGEEIPFWRGRTVAFIAGSLLGLTWCRYDKKLPRK